MPTKATYARRSIIENIESVNVGGAQNVLRVAEESGARRFVHTSSFVASFCVGAEGRDEAAPYSTAPDTYAATKIAAERAVLAANGERGLYTCAIRPGGIYGPGERFTYGRLVRALKAGVPLVVFGDGRSKMDYVYIDSLVDAQLRAAVEARDYYDSL